MILRNLVFATCLFSLVFTSQASADLILGNTFDGSTVGSSAFSAGQQTDANITSVGVTRPGYTANGGFDALVAGELRTGDGGILNFTRFFGFDITPVNGATVDFSNFSYAGIQDIFEQGQPGGGTNGATKFDLRSSLDDFGASIPGATLSGGTIDLSVPQFQGITAPIEFRLYIQSIDTGESSNTTYSLEEFSFHGTVTAVPEPASLLVFSIVGGIGLLRRKRQPRE